MQKNIWILPNLTDEPSQPQRSFVSRGVAAEEVDGHSRQGDADADQGVDGVTVQRHHHQEDGEDAENNGVEQTELWKEKRERAGWDDGMNYCLFQFIDCCTQYGVINYEMHMLFLIGLKPSDKGRRPITKEFT